MPPPLADILSADKGLIFRITHLSNLSFILHNGVHCRSSEVRDPTFITIGSPELIQRRKSRAVPIGPGGTLENYVAFYFTPHSPMLLNIRTGRGGVTQRPNDEIVILVSSLAQLQKQDVRYVFTDRHAYLQTAEFYSDRSDLDRVDFPLLRSGDFARDPDDPGKFERYQAEALAYGCVPRDALIGIACYTTHIKQRIESIAAELGIELSHLAVRPDWYLQ